jgi:hypothetical protein
MEKVLNLQGLFHLQNSLLEETDIGIKFDSNE